MQFRWLAQMLTWQSGRVPLAGLLFSVALAGCTQVPGVEKFLYATNADRDDAVAAGDADVVGVDADGLALDSDTAGEDADAASDGKDSVAEVDSAGDADAIDATPSCATLGTCDDGDPCTDDSCVEGTGCTHKAKNCDDGDPCTLDACDASGCKHSPGSTCGDGTCAGTCGETMVSCPADCHKCGDGICSPGEGPASCAVDCCGSCGDGKCIGFACGESAKTCLKDCGTACGNGVCDTGENTGNCPEDCKTQVCGNGVCEPGDGGAAGCPQDCGSSCGDCTCQAGETFSNCPVDCGSCGDGVCSPCGGLAETATSCPADCTTTTDPCAGAWQTYCNDNSVCTDDTCQTGVGCVHVPNSANCSDGDACTSGDSCVNGTCAPGSALDCNDNNPCTADLCDDAVGCSHSPADGVSCSDGNACTLNDACNDGACVSGPPPDCNDSNVCTDDSCSAGKCVHLSNTATCTDSDACTSGEHCSGSTCSGATVVPCDDGKPCTADSCDVATGCVNVALSNTPCNDEDACTASDTCTSGTCVGEKIGCADKDPCTVDTCNSAIGCVHSLDAKALCDDGNACTSDDSCATGTCAGLLRLWQSEVATDQTVLAIAPRPDGGFVTVSQSNKVVAVRAWTKGGVNEWTNTISTNSARMGVAVAANGDVAVASSTGVDGAVNVYTSTGAVIAATVVPSKSVGELNAIVADKAGGYHAYGRLVTATDPTGDVWLVDLDATGKVMAQVSAGGPALDAFYTATVASDGSYLIGGIASKSSTSGPFLLKAAPGKSDPQNSVSWGYNYPSLGAGQFNQVVAASDGGAFAIGEVDMAGTGVMQVLMARVDASGNLLWSHVDNAKAGGTGTGAAKLAGNDWMTASVASNLMNRSALGADGVALWTMSPGTGGASKMATLADGTVAIASFSGGKMQVQRVDSFGHSDCAASGACLDKTLADCGDANACTSDECTASACVHPGQFTGTTCSDGDACHGTSLCASGSCAVGNDLLGFVMDNTHGPGNQIAALPDGSWVILTTSATSATLAVVAFTSTGVKKWAVPYSTFNVQAMFVDASGNIVLLGSDAVTMTPAIRRLAPDGTETGNWTVKVANATALTFGGGVDSSKNGYVLTATDAMQGYLLQVGNDGQTWGTHNVAGWSQVHAPVLAADGNVYVSGSSASGGNWKAFVAKYTLWGDQVWRYDDQPSGAIAMAPLTAPVLLPDGGCAVASATDMLRTLRFSADGALKQTVALATGSAPGAILPAALAATSDGSLIATTTQGSSALVWRIDPQGNLAGSLPLAVSAMPSSAMAVAVSAQDRVAVTSGAMSGTTILALWRLDGFLNDTCKASGTCVAKGPAACDQGNSCAVDSCASGGCTHITRADGAGCSDGNSCTYGDACASAVCKPGSPVLGSWPGSAQLGVAVVPWGVNSAAVSQTSIGVYAVVTKRDPIGTLLWTQKSLAAHVVNNSRPAIDMFGNLVVPGHDNTTNAAWIWQLDASGNPVGGSTGYTFGAWANSEFRAILTNNGVSYAVGSTGTLGATTNGDFWLVPLNSALGQSGTDWKFDTMDSTFHSNADVATSAALASDGNVFIIGSSTPVGSATPAMHVLKVDPLTGMVNWQFTNNMSGNGASYGNDIVATSDGGCLVAGSISGGGTSQSLWVARFDGFGVQQWNRMIGDNSGKDMIGNGAAVLQDGSFAVAGQAAGNAAHVWRFSSFGDAKGDWPLTGATASRIAEASVGGLLIAMTGTSPTTDSLVHTDGFGNVTCSGSGSCFDYTTKSCDDNNACTLDSCTGTCTHTNVSDGQWCEDGNACTVNETCTAGVCGNGKPALWGVVDPGGATAVVSAGSNGGSLTTAASSYGKFALRSWDWSGTPAGSVSPAGAYAGSGRMQFNGDGSFVVAGHTDSMTDTDPWIAKYSQNQQKMWIVSSGQVGPPDRLDAVIQRGPGGYWAVGSNISTNGLEQCWIQAFAESNGAMGDSPSISDPNANLTCVNARNANDGSFFAVGTSMGTGPMKGFIAKLGGDGVQKWTASWGTTAGVNFFDVAPTSDGGAIAVGTSGYANSDVALARFDGTGIKTWVRTLNYGGVNEGRSINLRDDGTIDIAGSCNSLFCLMHLSPSGSRQWQKTYGAGRALQLVPLNYNGAVLVGESTVNQIVRIDWSGNATCTDSGTCITMGQTNCSTSMECSSASCTASQCNVSQVADATPCEDGNPCTGGDSCSSGKCFAGGAGSCGDGICSCGDTAATCPADCP